MKALISVLVSFISLLFETSSFAQKGNSLVFKPFIKDTCFTKFSGDTLDIFSSSDYAYYPFGKIKNKQELPNSILKQFKVTDIDDGIYGKKLLNHGTDTIVLLFDTDREASPQVEYYIFKGIINDNSITLPSGVKVGMSKMSFFNSFFDSFPDQLYTKCKVLEIECCVDDVIHYYSFSNNLLISIKFR
jgi:hypothetical protein